MRTTLVVDDDVLEAARALAQRTGESVGKVLSGLARRALLPKSSLGSKNGVPLFPLQKDAGPVTLELVNRLRDEQD